ncbi:hypothetical protein J1605_018420 [Eschrichtius robustus]|uniref:Uncharacterized protein n=1 Tax=Eschrichtius robustus TaxID=9764 RepID=A0AB34HWP9_ESCRO|nr:hypothetical protein J1605_018420 [Eschrichtius robustus]
MYVFIWLFICIPYLSFNKLVNIKGLAAGKLHAQRGTGRLLDPGSGRASRGKNSFTERAIRVDDSVSQPGPRGRLPADRYPEGLPPLS